MITYPFKTSDGSTINIDAVDMTVRYRVKAEVLNSPGSYYFYRWEDGDRPDIIAQRYYGDYNMAWLVMLSAEVFDWVYEFPMSSKIFDLYLLDKYKVDDIYQLMSVTHHYEDGKGYIVDSESYIKSGHKNKKMVSIYDYESDLNESRRVIKLISKSYADGIQRELRNKLYDIKNTRKEVGYNG